LKETLIFTIVFFFKLRFMKILKPTPCVSVLLKSSQSDMVLCGLPRGGPRPIRLTSITLSRLVFRCVTLVTHVSGSIVIWQALCIYRVNRSTGFFLKIGL